jgi:hypothetical protein
MYSVMIGAALLMVVAWIWAICLAFKNGDDAANALIWFAPLALVYSIAHRKQSAIPLSLFLVGIGGIGVWLIAAFLRSPA